MTMFSILMDSKFGNERLKPISRLYTSTLSPNPIVTCRIDLDAKKTKFIKS
jgi:hypothetical protein